MHPLNPIHGAAAERTAVPPVMAVNTYYEMAERRPGEQTYDRPNMYDFRAAHSNDPARLSAARTLSKGDNTRSKKRLRDNIGRKAQLGDSCIEPFIGT